MQDILIRILPIILGLTFVAIVLMLLFDSDGWISKPPIINNAPLFSLIVALLSLFVTIMINKELTRIRRIENSISISINEVALKYNLRGGNLNTNLTYSLKNLGKKQALDVTALICIIKSDSSRNPQPKYQKWIDDQKSILTIDESLIRTFSFGNPFEKFYLIVRPQWYNEFFMEQQPTDENQDRIFYCESQYDEDNQIGGMDELDATERKKIVNYYKQLLKNKSLDSLPKQLAIERKTYPLKIPDFEIDGLYANISDTKNDGWFQHEKFLGSGEALFDIKANWNPTPLGFQKLMRFPPFYRLSDNQLLYGLISSDSPSNKIFFSENASNSNSPLTWGITTGHLAAKHDIVETGVHLRTNLSTGHMWVFFYVSTRTKKFGTHLDFEFFRSEPVIDLDAKDFENTGGEKSGGHVPWLLNTDGSIASPGDFIITVDFNYGDSIAKIGMRIWVNTNELGFMQSGFDQFNLLPNRPFSFTGSFEKSKNADGFGYAEIRPMISLAKSIISKKIENPDFFSIHNFQMSKANNEGQIITLAIDFSSLGLDIVPVVKPNQDLTFSYLLVKSRAAELFSSTLKDFSGPYKIGISLNLGD